MRQRSSILRFIDNPVPIWDSELAYLLVSEKSNDLKAAGLNNVRDYNTLGALRANFCMSSGNRVAICGDIEDETIFLEFPPLENMSQFYKDHGLFPYTSSELVSNDALIKLAHAMDALKTIGPAFDCVKKLVRTIQVLRQDDPEIDSSYSHPDIPFSIFISVCADPSPISNLRVAESILHEAMHLKLSLIEEFVPMVDMNSTHTYFSPWRDEFRPVRGVLHGMFVFGAIQQFYTSLLLKMNSAPETDFVAWRLEQIQKEFSVLTEFPKTMGLTKDGAILATNLLPSS